MPPDPEGVSREALFVDAYSKGIRHDQRGILDVTYVDDLRNAAAVPDHYLKRVGPSEVFRRVARNLHDIAYRPLLAAPQRLHEDAKAMVSAAYEVMLAAGGEGLGPVRICLVQRYLDAGINHKWISDTLRAMSVARSEERDGFDDDEDSSIIASCRNECKVREFHPGLNLTYKCFHSANWSTCSRAS